MSDNENVPETKLPLAIQLLLGLEQGLHREIEILRGRLDGVQTARREVEALDAQARKGLV